MSLLDEIESSVTVQGAKCAVGAAYNSMNESDQRDLLLALRRWPAIQDTAVARALQNREFGVKSEAVARHRRRLTNVPGDRCSCPIPLEKS